MPSFFLSSVRQYRRVGKGAAGAMPTNNRLQLHSSGGQRRHSPSKTGVNALTAPLAHPTVRTPLFLPQRALRVEVADAARLATGAGIDHRIDECGLTRIHRRVDGPPELVGACYIDAGAAERLHHLVVTGAL